jgi:hypothetical protein
MGLPQGVASGWLLLPFQGVWAGYMLYMGWAK